MVKQVAGSAIPMTRRELERARRIALSAAEVDDRTNAHRLLLFYAAECGLKALFLKMRQMQTLDDKTIEDLGHNVNKVLDELNATKSLRLPNHLQIQDIQINSDPVRRSCNNGQINQVWRYGAKFIPPHDDATLEQKLVEINEWIESYRR